jgi:hypothetical protein
MAKRGTMYEPSEPDRSFVERAIMAGTRVNDIADALGITDDTLRKHFRFEIMTARERLKGKAVGVLMANLDDNNLDAAKFVLSRVAGWREGTNIDVTSGGEKLPTRVVFVAHGADDHGDDQAGA